MQPLVYIIVLNYNGVNDTIECINSLKNIKYNNYKVIILDNNSSDGSEKILKRIFYNYQIIQNGKNLGFAAGNNIGIQKALEMNAEYILLLNNDTTVEKDLLKKMIESFSRFKNSGIVGAKIFSYQKQQWVCHAGGKVDFFKFITRDYTLKNRSVKELKIEKEVNFISGCCMLIHRDVFNKIGLLPEEYFMYYEDTDFCTKALEKGFKLIYNPEAVIYHKESASTGGFESPFAIKWNIRNRIIFMKKYRYKVNKLSFFLSIIYFIITRFIRCSIYLYKKDRVRIMATWEGIKEGLRQIKSGCD